MPGGGLRILPHKTWHVWKRDNIERVERDKRLHAEEQERLKDKQEKVDAEQRLQILRDRVKTKKDEATTSTIRPTAKPHKAETALAVVAEYSSDNEDSVEISTYQLVDKSGHINLFAETEKAEGTNEDYEREKKEKEARDLRKIGTAPMALGHGTRDPKREVKPWYEEPSLRQRVSHPVTGDILEGAKLAYRIQRDERRKERDDPMQEILKVAKVKRIREETSEVFSGQTYKRRHRDVEKDQGGGPLHTRARKVSEVNESKAGRGNDMEALREARIKREKAEQERVKQLLISRGEQTSRSKVDTLRDRAFQNSVSSRWQSQTRHR